VKNEIVYKHLRINYLLSEVVEVGTDNRIINKYMTDYAPMLRKPIEVKGGFKGDLIVGLALMAILVIVFIK
jgi:hypothetical protein